MSCSSCTCNSSIFFVNQYIGYICAVQYAPRRAAPFYVGWSGSGGGGCSNASNAPYAPSADIKIYNT